MNRWIALFAILLLVPAAFAADDAKSQAMEAAVAHAQCRIAFVTGAISTVSTTLGVDLSKQTSTLQSDATQMQGITDPKTLRDFIQNHLEVDAKGAAAALKAARQSAKNVSKDAKQSIMTSLKSLQDTDKSCEFQALQKVANARVAFYNDQLDKESQRLTNLSGKIDTTQMQQIVSDAKSQVITPLQTAVSAATDAKSLQAAFKQYCLYSGCKDGVNFHLAAKLAVARLQAQLNKIKTYPQAANATAKITAAQTAIDSASSALTSVGTADYTPQTHDQVWNAIKNAGQALKDILSKRAKGTGGAQ